MQCKRMVMHKIADLVKNDQNEKLNEINQYKVHSAWFDVDYGGCKFGIFSATCPVEPLLALENGLISDCLKVLFTEELNASSCAELNQIVRKLPRLPQQH